MSDIRNLFNADLSVEHIGVLQQTRIEEQSPGPLLKNIDTLINFIGTGLKTSSAYFALPQGVLAELNEALVDPLPHDLKRPQLRSFPTLMGLFMLLRSSGLAIGETKPKRMILIDPAVLEQWQSLNLTERFFSLLTSCLYDASLDCVGMRSRRGTGMVNEIRDTCLRLPKQVTVLNDERFGVFYSIEESVAESLLHQFGWLRLDYDTEPKSGKASSVRRVERTEFGDAMFVATRGFGSYSDQPAAVLHEKLQPMFPAWTRTLAQFEPTFRDGNYTFRISLGKIWRRMVAPANADLEQLAAAILTAFHFDREHLYQFELRDATGNSMTIAGPYLDDASHFVEEMRIGELPLLIGESMVFHYDFRYDWHFKVTLEAVVEGKASALKVIAKSGQSPKQYDRDNW